MFLLVDSPPRHAAALGLAAAAAAIPIQIAGGADYPAVPPGLVVLLVGAAAMAFLPGRAGLTVASAVTLFISIGAVATPNLRDQLSDPGQSLVFLGSILQSAGLLLAVAAGVAAWQAAGKAGRARRR